MATVGPSLIEPGNYDVLLVGPRVARLNPFFEQWGYRVAACDLGSAGLAAMAQQRYHLVILELELEDLESHEFLHDALQVQPDAAYMLLDDAAKTGSIVSTFVQGIDCYVSTPPDEKRLYQQVGRHVLAAAARGGGTGDEVAQANEEVEQARSALRDAGGKLRALTQENKDLAQQNKELEGRVQSFDDERLELETDNGRLEEEVAKLKSQSTAMVSLEGAGISQAELEDMASKADFVSFLESENDDLKTKMKSMRGRLLALGDEELEAEDEETGEGDAVLNLDAVSSLADGLISLDDSGEASQDDDFVVFEDAEDAEDAEDDRGTASTDRSAPAAESPSKSSGDNNEDADLFQEDDLFFDDQAAADSRWDQPPAQDPLQAKAEDDSHATAVFDRPDGAALPSLSGLDEALLSEDGLGVGAEAGFSNDDSGFLNEDDEQTPPEGTLVGDDVLDADEEAELAELLRGDLSDDESEEDAPPATAEIALPDLRREASLLPSEFIADEATDEPTRQRDGIGTGMSSQEGTLVGRDVDDLVAGAIDELESFVDSPTAATPVSPAGGAAPLLDHLPSGDDSTRVLDADAVSALRSQLAFGSPKASATAANPAQPALPSSALPSSAVDGSAPVAEAAFVDDEATRVGAEVPPEVLAAIAAERAAKASVDDHAEGATHVAEAAPELTAPMPDDDDGAFVSTGGSALVRGDDANDAFDDFEQEKTNAISLASLSADELFGSDLELEPAGETFASSADGGEAPIASADDFDEATAAFDVPPGMMAEPGTQVVDGIAGADKKSEMPASIELDDDF